MNAALQEVAGNGVMKLSVRDDDRSFDVLRQLVVMSTARDTEFGRNLFTRLGAGVDDTNQFDARMTLQQTSVNASEMSSSDDGDAQSSHAALRRSRPRPCRPSCWSCTKLSKWLTV